MHVGESRVARIADFAELFPGSNLLPLLHTHRGSAEVAILRLPTLPMIQAHAIATLMVGNCCTVFSRTHKMVTHAITQAHDDSRRRGKNCDVFLNISYSADANVGARMAVIGLTAA